MRLCLICVLLWATTAYCQWNSNMRDNREVMVHLFEWKWSDVAEACETFLGPRLYGGVQVSPPSEHRTVWNPFRPWWERYQPVSYQLVSRSGDRNAFIDMVNRCNAKDVLIYPDLVINHMTGDGVNGDGTAGNPYNTRNPARDFPGVPYSRWDFNDDICDRDISNYNDAWEVRNCRLLGLVDLKLSDNYVRDRVVDFANDMINIGVAGFRVVACKHMWPGDLEVIYNRFNNLITPTFPSGSRPFIVQEVIDQGGEPIKATDYTHLGRVTEFNYGLELSNCFSGNKQLRLLENWGEDWGLLQRNDTLAFIDNHDNQRGHGGGGGILTHKQAREYKMAVEFMLAHDYGIPRVMSSYYFTDTEAGPPSHPDGSTKDVVCFGEWVCEHQWRQIAAMVWFRRAAFGTGVDNWWDNGGNQIAFSRGNKAFIAINGDSWTMNASIYTGLPGGSYCNLIVADYNSGSRSCTDVEQNGTPHIVTVSGNGNANINIPSNGDPVVAIHVEATV
ncbi:alpha-amylase 2-like [Ptychodera flava]|uniref:alpha-amylase 2-like n=1 Tax=Ptychodera flava TaxID=63121 RepID=UPI00396A9157